METFVLMIFILITPDYSSKASQTVAMHSVYGFDSEFSCEQAYNALAPSGFGMTVNHACRAVIIAPKIPDPMFVVPLVKREPEVLRPRARK